MTRTDDTTTHDEHSESADADFPQGMLASPTRTQL